MKNKKLILGGGVIGVVLIGLVTNAIWDGLRPLTMYLFKLTLNLSTLGIEKYKDSIYIEISKGMHEATSLQLFLTIYGLIFGFIFSLILLTVIKRKVYIKENNKENLTFFDKFFLYQKDVHKKSWFLWFVILYVLFTGTIFMLDSVKQKYINNAVTNFEQLSKIIHPYISDKDNLKYISFFSQIKNKEDYSSIIKQLQNIAKDNNQSIPEFNFTF